MATHFDERIARLRQRMQKTGTDLVVLGPHSHLLWLTGVEAHGDERPCLLLVSDDRAGFLMPRLNASDCRKDTDLPFFEWSDADGPAKAFADLLDHMDAARASTVVIDETMRADFALFALDALPGVSRRFTDDTIGYLRRRKDAFEYERLKDSAGVNDRAFQAAVAGIRPGMSERELAKIIADHYPLEGARAAFSIVGASENGAYPHHASSERTFRAGDAIVVDIGGRKAGYPSDMTRMIVLGEPPAQYEQVHETVERAVRAALAAARPGARACDVDNAARTVIADAGFGEFFLHRTGHGTGLDIHEPPYITETSDTTLETGMVFSIEPGIYLPNRFGVRLEDIVILREDGPEILSTLPRTAARADV